MNHTKLILTLLLFTLFAEATNDRSIYRKTYANENKVALVIGNSSYTNFSVLKNTINDAEDMRDVLKAKGFDVLFLKDGDLRSMEKILRKFSYKLKKGGVGLFYYAGHGLEIEGNNYLIPTKAEIPEQDEVKYESLAVNLVIDKMKNSHNRLNIIVLDACRSNPFGRDGGGGLAQINSARGMYIAFATAPGKVASDGGNGKNGLFTKHLIYNISQPNFTLNEVFKQTRASVDKESNSQQLPWTSSSIIGDFYFQLNDAKVTTAPPAPLVVAPSMSDEDRAELANYRQNKIDAEQAKEKAKLEEFRRIAKLKEEKKAKAKADELAEFEQYKRDKLKREAQAKKERLAKEVREAKAKEEAKNRYTLTIKPTPSNAKVQITNIKPRYKDGILLKKGIYKIKVSKKGYKSVRKSISLKKDLTYKVVLKKEEKKIKKVSKKNLKGIVKIGKRMWQDQSINKTKLMNWNQAIAYCRNLRLGGYSDWSLPSSGVLSGSRSHKSKLKYLALFWYWSSTTDASGTSNAWVVYFYDGGDTYDGKSNSHFVRCVRAGQ